MADLPWCLRDQLRLSVVTASAAMAAATEVTAAASGMAATE